MVRGEYLDCQPPQLFCSRTTLRGPTASVERRPPMPTVLRSGPYRIYFYSHDRGEPPHVHVDRDGHTAKFWLGPLALARNLGFSWVEVRKIRRILNENRILLIGAWNDYFGTESR